MRYHLFWAYQIYFWRFIKPPTTQTTIFEARDNILRLTKISSLNYSHFQKDIFLFLFSKNHKEKGFLDTMYRKTHLCCVSQITWQAFYCRCVLWLCSTRMCQCTMWTRRRVRRWLRKGPRWWSRWTNSQTRIVSSPCCLPMT